MLTMMTMLTLPTMLTDIKNGVSQHYSYETVMVYSLAALARASLTKRAPLSPTPPISLKGSFPSELWNRALGINS